MRAPSVVVAVLLTSLSAAAAQDEAAPFLTLQAEDGYYEESFALDGAGGRLAVVRTDASGAHELQLLDLDQKGAVLSRFPVGAAAPSAVTLASGGIYVVARSAEGGRAEAALYDPAGKLLRRFGPASELVVTEKGGKEMLAAFDARGTTWEVALHPGGAAKPAVRRTLVLDAAGSIPALGLTPLYWRGGYAQLVGRRGGRYDKAKDRQMNDTEAVYDVAKGAMARDAAPGDLMAWTRVTRERARRPNQDAFVYVSEDQQHIYAVAADDKVVELELPLAAYEPSSLQQQLGPDGRILFSLTVDPLNPDALARQKRDPELIDVYRFDPAAAASQPARLLRIPRAGRDFQWRAGATRLAVLRKHKAFGSGGPQIDVYEWK